MKWLSISEFRETMIKVEHLTKRFGKTVAVDDLSFDVDRGEIVGFLGPNGAGKTTTMRVLTGYLPATYGHVNVAGFDVIEDSLEVRRRIGYLPENFPVYPDMRVVEYLQYRGNLKGMGGRRLRLRVEEVIYQCGLDDVRRTVIGHLSKGYRQRVGLADSLVHEPELLILDEPTIGLDPNQIRHIRGLIKSLAERHTVLLSSHILPEVEMICERVLIINKGAIVASDTPENLVSRMKGGTRINAEISGPGEIIAEKLRALAGIEKVMIEPCGGWNRFVCDCKEGYDVRNEMFTLVSEQKWSLRELASEKKNLEDVFVAMTADNADTDEEADDPGGDPGREGVAGRDALGDEQDGIK